MTPVEIALQRYSVYPASSLRHREKWKVLRKSNWLPIRASWLDDERKDEDLNREQYGALWVTCLEEAAHSAAVFFYQVPGDSGKGALSEIGAALVSGVPVVYLGHRGIPASFEPRREESFLPILHHPLVRVVSTHGEALEILSSYVPGVPT